MMNSVHYNVSGIAGPESKTKIKNALNKIEGIENVFVDVARGSVEVKFNYKTSDDEIKQCIEHTGYRIE